MFNYTKLRRKTIQFLKYLKKLYNESHPEKTWENFKDNVIVDDNDDKLTLDYNSLSNINESTLLIYCENLVNDFKTKYNYLKSDAQINKYLGDIEEMMLKIKKKEEKEEQNLKIETVRRGEGNKSKLSENNSELRNEMFEVMEIIGKKLKEHDTEIDGIKRQLSDNVVHAEYLKENSNGSGGGKKKKSKVRKSKKRSNKKRKSKKRTNKKRTKKR